jgi:hypothetical protein
MQAFGTRRVKNSSILWMCLGIWKAKAQKAQTWSTFVRPCRRTMSHAIIRRRLVVRGAVGGSAIRTLKMKSATHARCRREMRAAKRRTPLHESGSRLLKPRSDYATYPTCGLLSSCPSTDKNPGSLVLPDMNPSCSIYDSLDIRKTS